MKTNFKFFTLAIVALLMVGFSSCSSDDDPAVDNPAETKSVFLKISNGPSTRAEGASQAGDAVLFESGHLYFTNTSGDILRYHSIGTEGDILTTELASGHLVKNLNASVTNVYIVGNYKGTSAIPKSGNISGVKTHVLKVEDQIQVDGKNVVNLYGESDLTAPVDPATYYTATVHLAPTVARIELTDITAAGRITSFKVSGIYIDRFYTGAQVDGAVTGEPVASSTADTDYTGDTKYTATLQGAVYDSKEEGWADESLIAKPAGAAVWGYNLFAGKYAADGVGANSTGVDTPHIVIRFSKIGTAEGDISFDAPQFITIKNSLITKIKPGHVYTIKTGALVFDETNLTAAPNEVTMDVEVTVTLAKWIPVNFIPEL